MSDFLKEIQIAGLFHDIGKFIHKTSTTQYNKKLKHQELSKDFIEKNQQIFNEYDIDIIKKIVLYHHNDIPKELTKEEKILIDILKISDSFSASGDRRSENQNNTSDGHSEYAPIFSIVSQIMSDEKYAVIIPNTNNINYQVKLFDFDNDTKETMTNFDYLYINKLNNLFLSFCEELFHLNNYDFEKLDELLEKYLIYINPNTWRPPNSQLGNTTTSLYDHSKTTSAIAGCCYRHYKKTNELPNKNNSNVTFFHIYLNNIYECIEDISLKEVILDELENIGLYKTCIIGNMENELYFLYPNSDVLPLTILLKEFNQEWFEKYGITLNYEYIENWEFSKNIEFNQEFSSKSIKFNGIKEIFKNNKNLTPNILFKNYIDENYLYKNYNKKLILGFKINNYYELENKLLNDNNSISKLTTFLRTFENFYQTIKKTIMTYNCEIIKISYNSMFFTCTLTNLLDLEKDINNIYHNYFGNVTGLTFSYIECKKYINCLEILNNDIDKIYNSKISKDVSNKQKSYSRFGCGVIELNNAKVKDIQQNITKINKINSNSLKYKIIYIYKNIIDGIQNNNPYYLVDVSKLNYLISKAKNKEEQDFIKEYFDFLLNEVKNKVEKNQFQNVNVSKIKYKYEILKLSIKMKGN